MSTPAYSLIYAACTGQWRFAAFNIIKLIIYRGLKRLFKEPFYIYPFFKICKSFFQTNTYLSNRESFLFGILGVDFFEGDFFEREHREFIQGKACSSAQFHCLGYACDSCFLCYVWGNYQDVRHFSVAIYGNYLYSFSAGRGKLWREETIVTAR